MTLLNEHLRQVRDTEHYLRTVFENMTEGIILARLDGQIIHWNPAGLAMHRFHTMEEALVRVHELEKILEISTFDGGKLRVEDWPLARVLRGERLRDVMVRVRRLDLGWAGIMRASGQLVPGPDEAPLAFITITDETERMRALQALEESEARLRLANEAAGIGTYVTDMETGMVEMSPALCAILGIEAVAEIPHQAFLRQVHPVDLAALQPLALEAIDPAGSGRIAETVRIIRPDGEVRWVAFSVRTLYRQVGTDRIPSRRVGSCFDVTDLRRAERRLATQNRVSRVLAEAATLSEATPRLMQAICESEGWDEGVIWHVDRKAGVLRCADVWHPPASGLEELAAMTRGLCFAPGQGLPGRVWRLSKPLVVDLESDDDYVRRERALRLGLRRAMAFPITVAGEVTGVIDLIGRDVAPVDEKLMDMFASIGQQLGAFFERKRVEQERHALEAQLLQSQKMDALGQLSGGIAHDFNNILTAIIGNLGLAQETSDPEEVAMCLAEIETASTRAQQLVRKILTFSRKQPQDRQPISVAPVVRECVDLLRATLPACVTLSSSVAADAPHVLADATQLHQLIINLGTNAWHALEGRAGSVSIRATRAVVDEATAASLGLPRGGVHCHLSVSDTGAGMDEATQARAFEPFFTTKEAGRGTGLGLSVVYGIVRSHEGAIVVKSAPSQGATFDIYLPATKESGGASARPASRERRGSGQRVMYIEDEPALGGLVERAMARRGYDVRSFLRPEAALSALRKDPHEFALVLSDMNMPGLSGLQVAQEILQIRPDMPVILTSGNVTRDLQESSERIGVREVLHKPTSITELTEAFYRVLGERAGNVIS